MLNYPKRACPSTAQLHPKPQLRLLKLIGSLQVKIAAQYQPVLPPPAPGSPFTPVEFDGMTVFPYVDASRCQGQGPGRCGARMAYSLKATGVRAPSRGLGRPAPEHKDAA